MSSPISNVRPKTDQVILDIADYALKYSIKSNEAYNTVMSNVNDALGSGGWAEAMNTWQATNATLTQNIGSSTACVPNVH